MPCTYTFTADAIGDPEPVVIQSVCKRVRFRQTSSSNFAFKVRAPLKTSVPIPYLAGMEVAIECPFGFFRPGDIVAWVAMDTGADLFKQIED